MSSSAERGINGKYLDVIPCKYYLKIDIIRKNYTI